MPDRNVLHETFDRPVHMHPVLRVALAMVVIVGGLFFLLFPVMLIVMPRPRAFPHPLGVAALLIVMAAMGCGFLYIGRRLIRSNAATVDLLGPRARRVCAAVCGASAVAMAIYAWYDASVLAALSVVTASAMAYGMYRTPTARRALPVR